MKKLLLIPLLLLGGCASPSEQKAAIESYLPPGCTFNYVGRYQGIDVTVIRCKKQDTVTTSTTRRSGKTTHDESSTVIEE